MRKFLTYSASCLALSIYSQDVLAQNFEFAADYLRYDEKREWVSLSGAIELKTEYGYFYPSAIEYDVANEKLYIDGEMRGVLPTGERIIAQYVDLDFQTQAAVINSARILLNTGMQATAKRFDYSDTAIYAENIVASTCTVCIINPTPIWQIRAEQIYLDNEAQKVYVRNGFFDFFGLTLSWIPYLRFPAPEVVRMEGFLPLTFKATTGNTRGLTMHYYYPFSDTTDATASIQIGPQNFQVTDGQFRHNGQGYKFQTDAVYINSSDPEEDGRYQVIEKLALSFPYGWNGQMRYTAMSDYDVDNNYDLVSPKSNYFYIEKYTNEFWSHAEFLDYLPSTEGTKDREYPTTQPHIQYEYSRLLDAGVQLNTDLDLLYLEQDLSEDITRVGSDLSLNSVNILPMGILSTSRVGIQGGLYDVDNASTLDDEGLASRLTPFVGVDFQLPYIQSTELADYVLTPRMMVAWSENYDQGVPIPNTDSLFVEHDFVSLFSENHFTGRDQFESGFRGSMGLSYRMIANQGQNFELGLGRIWRSSDFLDENGMIYPLLDDWVGYLNYSLNDQWNLYSRYAVDSDFTFSRSEVEFNYDDGMADYSLEWVRLAPEPEIGFNDIRSEILLDVRHQYAPNWQVNYDLRYDLVDQEPFDADLSLTYGNECIEVRTGASWDFSSSANSEIETSYQLNVEFFGLSGDRKEKWAKRTCSHRIIN